MGVCSECKNLKIDPLVYLTDVLGRVSTHSGRRIEELLPDRWQALRAVAAMHDGDRVILCADRNATFPVREIVIDL